MRRGAAGLAFLAACSATAAGPGGPPPVVVVTTFHNQTGDPDLEWLTYGLREAVNGHLRHLSAYEAYYPTGRPDYPEWNRLDRLGEASDAETLRQARELHADQLWVGALAGSRARLSVRVLARDVGSGRTLGESTLDCGLESLPSRSGQARRGARRSSDSLGGAIMAPVTRRSAG